MLRTGEAVNLEDYDASLNNGQDLAIGDTGLPLVGGENGRVIAFQIDIPAGTVGTLITLQVYI